VANLAVTVSVDWLIGSVVDGGNSSGDGGSNDWSVDGMVDRGVHGMSNNWCMDSMSKNWSMDSMGNNRSGSVSWSWSHDSGLVGRGGLVGGGRLVGGLLRVRSCALVGHISDESIVAVGGVGDLLDSTIGESHSVGSLDIAGTIGGLLSIEVRLGVVVSNGVGVGVGGDLISVGLGLVSWSRSISWGSVDSVSHNWGSVDSMSKDWSVDGVMDRGMDEWSMGNSVGYGGDGVEGGDSSLSSGDDLVGSNGGLNLSQTLGVVHLGH